MTASPYTNLPVGTPPSQKQGIGVAARFSSPSPAASSSTTAGATQPTAAAVAAVAAAAAAAAMTVEEMKEMPSAEEARSSSQSAPVSDPAFRQSRSVFAKDSIARRSIPGRSSTPPPKAQRPILESRQSLSAPTSRAASPVRGELEINKRTIARRKQQHQESTMIIRSLSPPPPPTPPPTRSQSPFTTKSLVVDDNNITGEILSRILRKDFGHSVTCVVSGEDALEKLANDVFNMCFLDIDMPGINGIETTLVIRRKVSMISDDTNDAEDTSDADIDEGDRDSKGKNIHIVQAASAHVLDENRDIPIIAYTTNTCVERYLEAGMNGFITKPPSRRSLKNELDRIL